jgi:hypothetical protein
MGSVILLSFNKNLGYIDKFMLKIPHIKLTENSLSGFRVVVCGQTWQLNGCTPATSFSVPMMGYRVLYSEAATL